MLQINKLNVSIGSTNILNDLSISADGFICLLGNNGAGKTTLMRSIMGLLPVQKGNIFFKNENLTILPSHKRSLLGIGYMPEDRRLIPELSIKDNILLPAWATKDKNALERLEWIFSLMPELANMESRLAIQLSGGQQKMVALGRALMTGKRLLLLDEPFEGVAPVLAKRLVEVIATLKSEGITVFLAESDSGHFNKFVESVFRIERGVIIS